MDRAVVLTWQQALGIALVAAGLGFVVGMVYGIWISHRVRSDRSLPTGRMK